MKLKWARTGAAWAIVTGFAVTQAHVGRAEGTLPLVVNGKHVLWAANTVGAPSANQYNDLIYHGGLVETAPAVYLDFWGPGWNGFSVKEGAFTYTSKTIQTYVQDFFKSVGGSPWIGSQTQYCDNIDPGFDCTGQPYAQYITNPKNQLKGVWFDSSPVPSTIATTALAENATNDPVATEAIAAAQHFGYNINATYIILTQPGIAATAYGSVYCAYHAETSHTTGHGVRYAFVPYVPEQGTGCGDNSVNSKNNAFGNGYLDSYSIVAGHEYAEAITDPDNQMGTQDGWNDATTEETGDKCAWVDMQNIKLGGLNFAVQPLWSNEAAGGAGACAYARGTS